MFFSPDDNGIIEFTYLPPEEIEGISEVLTKEVIELAPLDLWRFL